VEQSSGSSRFGHLCSDSRLQDGERPDPVRQDWKNHQIHSRRHRGIYQFASHRRLNENSPSCATIQLARRKAKWVLSKLRDGGRFCLRVLGFKFFETAAAKAVPECHHPHFQHSHLLVICHRIDLALHNFEPLAESAADDWFLFSGWFKKPLRRPASSERKSSRIGCLTASDHRS